MIRWNAWAGMATLALSLLTASGGAAAQTSFAAQTGVGTISNCPSFCNGPSFFDSDGGVGFTFSESALSNDDGNGRAEAALTGQVGLPILKAEAYASTTRSSQVSASAVGMQGFYVGAGGLSNYELTATLTGQATGTVRADVLVFRDLDPLSVPFFTSHLGTMQFEVIPLSGDLEMLATGSLALSPDGSVQSRDVVAYIDDLNPGDLFYVWARLSASGQNGTYGDAFNTLTLNYANAAGLTQLAPVPEPGAWAMFAAGLALLAARRRAVRRA